MVMGTWILVCQAVQSGQPVMSEHRSHPTMGIAMLGERPPQNQINSRDFSAAVNWKNSWRMPTKDEFKELLEQCKWVSITLRGHKGYKIIGLNGKSIFLPAAGWINGTGAPRVFYDEYCFYWSSTSADDNYRAFDNDGELDRYVGVSIRPVSK